MLMKKNLVILAAIAALVSACGGGGGGTPKVVGGEQTTDTTTPPSNNTGNPPPADPVNPPDEDPSTPADQQLAGDVRLVANQMAYIRTNRSIYNAIAIEAFESEQGMYDFASGTATPETDVAVPSPAAAPAAPIAAVGFRVDKFVHGTGDMQVSNQTVVGRIAFSFTERAGSAGIGENEMAEIMQFVIDGVELSTDENGQLSAKVREGAQMHVYGRNAGNEEVRETIPVPAGAVQLLDVSEVLDNLGDTTSTVLLVDLETAFSQAGQKLAALENIRGHFATQVTMSVARIVRPAEGATEMTPELEERVLIGEPITVNTQPAVTGAGISGNAWIRMYPPQP
ncbi:hypothetical protein GCM10027343_38790 [Noviherbaspirillum agri]